MTIKFNADEIFQMAERMEKNAAAYYRKAAELHAEHGSESVDFLSSLAAMEDEHLKTFADMRKHLPDALREQTAFDPYMESSVYLQSMSDSRHAEGDPALTEQLTGEESLEAMLKTAITLEQKAIAFYVGLKDLVPENLGKESVEAIIAEEKGHVVTLANRLKSVHGT